MTQPHWFHLVKKTQVPGGGRHLALREWAENDGSPSVLCLHRQHVGTFIYTYTYTHTYIHIYIRTHTNKYLETHKYNQPNNTRMYTAFASW